MLKDVKLPVLKDVKTTFELNIKINFGENKYHYGILLPN